MFYQAWQLYFVLKTNNRYLPNSEFSFTVASIVIAFHCFEFSLLDAILKKNEFYQNPIKVYLQIF